MRAYEPTNAVAGRKQVKKVHAKARFVGVLYFLGALILAVLACLPLVEVNGEQWGIMHYVDALLSVFGSQINWTQFALAVLYVLLVLSGFINFLITLFKLGWLSNRSSRYLNGYNRNMRAMDQMGERFSGTFARMVRFYLWVWVLYGANVKASNFALIALAVALVIHFIAGLCGGTVSRFKLQGFGGIVEEEKRSCGLFVYFFRNIVQFAVIGGIVWFFMANNVFGLSLYQIFNGTFDFGADVMSFVPLAAQALIFILVLRLVRHATSAVEFNRLGVDGEKMRRFSVCSFFIALFAVAVAVLDKFLLAEDPATAAWNVAYIYIAVIGLASLLIHCIFKSRDRRERYMEQPGVDGMEQSESGKKKSRRERKRLEEDDELLDDFQNPVEALRDAAAQRPIYIYQQPDGQVSTQPPAPQQDMNEAVENRGKYPKARPGMMPAPMPMAAVPMMPMARPGMMPAPMPMAGVPMMPMARPGMMPAPMPGQPMMGAPMAGGPMMPRPMPAQPMCAPMCAPKMCPPCQPKMCPPMMAQAAANQPDQSMQPEQATETTQQPVELKNQEAGSGVRYVPYPIFLNGNPPAPKAKEGEENAQGATDGVAENADSTEKAETPAVPETDKQRKKREKQEKKDAKQAKKQEKKDEKAAKKQAKEDKKSAKKEKKLLKKQAKADKKQLKADKKAAKKGKKGCVAGVSAVVEEETVEFVKPAPSPSPKARQEEGIFENDSPLNPHKVFQVRCPNCGKHLNVRETSPYHRCPVCDKVFKIRKFDKYTLKK